MPLGKQQRKSHGPTVARARPRAPLDVMGLSAASAFGPWPRR